MPVVPGRWPVSRLARDGLHIGALQYACWNIMPRFSMRAMFGVRVCGCPPKPATQSFMSSTGMNRTLGRRAAAKALRAADPRKARRVRERVMPRLWRGARQFRQRFAGEPEGGPVAQGDRAERFIETNRRRVPIEDRP